MTTGTVSWATLRILEIHWQTATRDEDIDLESGEYVPVGHIWKFDLEQCEWHDFGVKWNFSKIRIGHVMLKFLATTENIRKIRSEQPIYNRGKVLEKSSGKMLFAISRYKSNASRAVLSWNRRRSDYKRRTYLFEVNQSEPTVERWTAGVSQWSSSKT